MFAMEDQAAAPHDNLYGLDNNDTIPYDANGVVKLVIIDPGGDGDWVDTKFHHDPPGEMRMAYHPARPPSRSRSRMAIRSRPCPSAVQVSR